MQRTTLRDASGLEIMGVGLHWDDVEIGDRFRTLGRTITEADITAYVAAVGMVATVQGSMADTGPILERPSAAAEG